MQYADKGLHTRIGPFDIGVFLLAIKQGTGVTLYLPLPKTVQELLVFASCQLMLIEIVCYRRYRKKTLLYLGMITALALYSSLMMKNYLYLSVWLLLVGSVGYETKKVVKIIWSVILTIFIFSIFLSLAFYFLGYDREILMNVRRGGVRGFTFGFTHPNKFSIILSNISFMHLWLCDEKKRPGLLGMIFILQLFFFLFTKTRTSLVISLVILILLSVHSLYPKYKLGFLAGVFPVTGLGLGLLTYAFYPGKYTWALLADRLLTGRVRFWSYAAKHFGISLLGRHIDYQIAWDPVWRLNSFTFDSLYAFLNYNAGIIWFVIIGMASVKLRKKLTPLELILLAGWSLYAVTESDLFLPVYGFQLLFFTRLFTGANIKEEGDGLGEGWRAG